MKKKKKKRENEKFPIHYIGCIGSHEKKNNESTFIIGQKSIIIEFDKT